MFLVLAASTLSACSDKKENPVVPPLPTVPYVTLQELREAPENLKFDGISFTVDVDLWRDFVPPAPVEGRPLQVRAVVTAEGVDEYPPTIGSAYVWVVMGGIYWAARMEEAGSPAGIPNVMVYRADGGPLWGPNVVVDVVVGLRTAGTNLHLVQIKDVPIVRTD